MVQTKQKTVPSDAEAFTAATFSAANPIDSVVKELQTVSALSSTTSGFRVFAQARSRSKAKGKRQKAKIRTPAPYFLLFTFYFLLPSKTEQGNRKAVKTAEEMRLTACSEEQRHPTH